MNRFLLGWVVSALLGCGGNVVVDGATGTGGSTTQAGVRCDVNPGQAGHFCIFYAGLGQTCPDGNTVSTCPAANALGTCVNNADADAGISYSVVYYSDGGFTPAEAQGTCIMSSGVWTAAG